MRLAPTILALGLLTCPGRAASVLESVRVSDGTARHRHRAGHPVTVAVTAPGAGHARVSVQWVDAAGRAMAPAERLRGAMRLVSPIVGPGYLGLAFTEEFPPAGNVSSLRRREFGFALDADDVPSDTPPDLPLAVGLIAPDPNDPEIPGGLRLLTLSRLEDAGCPVPPPSEERPDPEVFRVIGEAWEGADVDAVTPRTLGYLRSTLRACFEEHPRVLHWELGRPVSAKARGLHYWDNLAAKAAAARQAADEVNPRIRLIYPTTGGPGWADFLNQPVADDFDAIGLQTLAWPDFPSPEIWMTDTLARVHAAQKDRFPDRPLWITAIGAPRQENAMEFFGNPRTGASARGLSRDRQADFLVKAAVLALNGGADRMFWHRAQDAADRPGYAEDHFGLIDRGGFPTPAWVAWKHLCRQINGLRPDGRQRSDEGQFTDSLGRRSNGVKAYRFVGHEHDIWVVWVSPEIHRHILWDDLGFSVDGREIEAMTDLWGSPRPVSPAGLDVTGSPLYLRVKN